MSGLASLFGRSARPGNAAPARAQAVAWQRAMEPGLAGGADAQALARRHRLAEVRGRGVLAAQFRARMQALTAMLQRLARRTARPSPAAHLLLAQRPALMAQLRRLRRDLRARYVRELPQLADDVPAMPRVLAVVRAALSGPVANADPDGVRRYVAGYQSVAPLTLGELRALPLMLRLVLLDALAAAACTDTPAAAQSLPGLLDALRRVDECDWQRTLEALSLTERTLRGDPAGVYPMMDAATRAQYRDVVMRLARRSGASEDNIARRALAFANFAAIEYDEHDCRTHVGYYLVDAGRRQLESALGVDTLLGGRELRLRERELRFFAALGVATGLVAGAAMALAERLGAHGAVPALVGVAAALGASELVVAAVLCAARQLLRPARLPRLDFSAGIPAPFRTLVVVAAVLRDGAAIEAAVAALDAQFAAADDAQLRYALLGDLADADAAVVDADAAIVAASVAAVERLNARYADGARAAIALLLRARSWDAGERRWIGRARRRGQLDDLNALLLDGDRAAFLHAPDASGVLGGVRYVIVLDADTRLARGGARAMVAALAHPLNRAVHDPATHRIVVGYGILRPRQVGRERHGGAIDGADDGARDVYQDAFGECRFAGCGIYDVAAYDAVVRGAFASRRLLDANLLPGSYARCGYLGDVVALRNRSAGWACAALRRERRLRSDWQLAPWLWSRVRNAGGAENPLSTVAQWWIVDRLRHGCSALALMALLLAAWFALPRPGLWTLLAVAASALASATRAAGHWRSRRRWPASVAMRMLCEFAVLPYAAGIAAIAIGRALTRQLVTQRRLLQWPDCADAGALAAATRWIWSIAGAGVLVLAAVAALRPAASLAAVPVVLPWLFAPLFVRRGHALDA